MIAVPYQICPRCNGDGSIFNNQFSPDLTTISSGMATCDVCHGAKIIPMHVIEEQVTCKETVPVIDMGMINDTIPDNKPLMFDTFYTIFKDRYMASVGVENIDADYDIYHDSKKSSVYIIVAIHQMELELGFNSHISKEDLHQHTFKSLAEDLYQEYLG